jgi:SnoaL-like domain
MTTDDRMRSLLVKDRLHELEMAYCRGVDRRDLALLQSIFFDDAIEDHGKMYNGSAHAFAQWVVAQFLPKYELTAHYVLNESYRVDGDRAEGETHRISYHRERGDTVRETFAASRTFTRYECRAGIWKISYRTLVRDWIRQASRAAESISGNYDMPGSAVDASDPSYAVLGLFRRGPLADSV